MKVKIYYIAAIPLFLLCALAGCKKIDNYLDVKSKLNDVRPTTLQDFQAILDNHYVMNVGYEAKGLVGTDNVYFTDNNYKISDEIERNCYLWEKDIWGGNVSYDYAACYKIIGYANIVIDGLKNVERTSSNKSDYDNIEGEAKFFRSYAYYTLSQLFCKPYDSSTAKNDLGLVIRHSSDVNEKSVRSTVEATYQQMINDFKDAITLLSVSSSYQTRPTRPAANGALAKVYLSMADYSDALIYTTAALNEYNTLLNYNDSVQIDYSGSFKFPDFPKNSEIIWWAQVYPLRTIYCGGIESELAYVDTSLYNLYKINDLRKTLYYINKGNGRILNAGSYTANYYLFCGIATNELYLIKAECEARKDNISEAMNDLNTLLINRYKTGTFHNLNASNGDEALKLILAERRKELAFTGQMRWEDLRRLNKDPRFAKTLIRTIDRQTYTLPPNDPRYVFPFPDEEIQLTGITQNNR